MSKKTVIDETAFDRLLVWLNPDREKAAQKYEAIRRRLIEMFASRRLLDPDVLADETIDRVTNKVPQLSVGWVGDPLAYFLGVAKNVILEVSKPIPLRLPPPPPPDPEELEREDRCVEHCLGFLRQEERKLILEYVAGNKQVRGELAKTLGITANALRIRVFQIKKSMRPCLTECLGQSV